MASRTSVERGPRTRREVSANCRARLPPSPVLIASPAYSRSPSRTRSAAVRKLMVPSCQMKCTCGPATVARRSRLELCVGRPRGIGIRPFLGVQRDRGEEGYQCGAASHRGATHETATRGRVSLDRNARFPPHPTYCFHCAHYGERRPRGATARGAPRAPLHGRAFWFTL